MKELRLWASYRGQTLSRTVRGLMYCDKAIQVSKLLEVEEANAAAGGGGGGGGGGGIEQEAWVRREHAAAEAARLRGPKGGASEAGVKWGEEATRIKYSYVITAQIYGQMDKSPKADMKRKAEDIKRLVSRETTACQGWHTTLTAPSDFTS